MSDQVQFEEDNFSYNSSKKSSAPGAPASNISVGYGHPQYDANIPRGMAGWLIKNGISKSPNSAQVILVAFVIFNVIITFIIIKYLL